MAIVLNQPTMILLALIAAPASAARSGNERSAAEFPARVLAAHNQVRATAGVAPLRWDSQLGLQAARFAFQLAITGTFAHASSPSRNGAGENLWMGSAGAFSVEKMVGDWASERRLFVRGVFPSVSRTGNWEDVGHYTQMIWPTTQRVGCAVAKTARVDYLVCRYWPAGNVYGSPVARSRELASSSLPTR